MKIAQKYQSELRKFYVMTPALSEVGVRHGMKLINEDELKWPGAVIFGRLPGRPPGFSHFSEKPRLKYNNELGHPPRDLESYNDYWLVSNRMRQVLEMVDAEAFDFIECEYVSESGVEDGGYYLCDVVRTMDALDEQASTLKIRFEKDHTTGEDVKIRGLLSDTKLVFHGDTVGDAHIFRQADLATGPICDDVMYSACSAAYLTGIRFRDVSN